jgi:hypothetical protein
LIAQQYTLPSPVRCSVMSVSHSWFGAVAVKSRPTRSSWTGGPTLPPLPLVFFLPNALHQPLSAQMRHTVRPHIGGLVDQEPVAELRVVSVGVEQRIGLIRLGQLGGGDGVGQPPLVRLPCELEDRHVTATGIPSAASSLTSG